MKYKHSIIDEITGERKECYITILEENLIKPEDLNKYIGEVLMFHNGKGYVVSGILETAEILSSNEFLFGKRYDVIEYTHELDMSWFYDQQELSEYETIMYAYHVVNLNIIRDEIMHNINYIAVPTVEELEFRKRILNTNPSILENRYHELKEIYDIQFGKF